MTMQTLFDTTPLLPGGFTYFEDFLTVEEEAQLLNIIAAMPLATMKFHAYEAKRKVMSFGQGWSFTDQVLTMGNHIPAEFDFLVEKLTRHLGIAKETIAQMLVTEYPPGAVINWHRDAPPYDLIAGISLNADSTLKLRPQEKAKQHRSAVIAVSIRRRSLYVLRGLVRTDWQHSTVPAGRLRYSITFRTLKATAAVEQKLMPV